VAHRKSTPRQQFLPTRGISPAVNPGLCIPLAGLSTDQLDRFMQIEQPESGTTHHYRGYAYPTIGAFYDAILHAFDGLNDRDISTDRQHALSFGPPINITKISTVEQAREAIRRIKQQGEGTPPQSPIGDPDFPGSFDKFAHYFKFAEIYHGAGLIISDGLIEYTGPEIKFPQVYPMAPVPPEGYPEKSAEFNRLFTGVLDALQRAWEAETGNDTALEEARDRMTSMKDGAVKLMQTPIPGGKGNYGPDFKIVH
jgi:Ferritin-like